MKEWTIRSGDPLKLTLAVDARRSLPDYLNDQIWELTVGTTEPPAIALQTTFGLRARSLRIFPRFGEAEALTSDPNQFSSPITIRRYCPDLVRLGFSPLPEIHAELTYWAASSHAIIGKLTLINASRLPRKLHVEIAGNLLPGSQGTRLLVQEVDATTILTGQTDGLEPVMFMIGGAQAVNSPFPALRVDPEIPENDHHTLTWIVASLSDLKSSLELARQLALRNLDAEVTRSEILDDARLEIKSGEPEWDKAFDLAQTIALSLGMGPTSHLPHPSFVFSRLPDLGFSLRRDGSDYNYLWNGQSPLEAYLLAHLILPNAPELVKGLILNYLAVQNEDGSIDWKPGLAGQRSNVLLTPLLASLAWLYYEYTEDSEFIAENFSRLLEAFKSWFNPLLDRDNDGFPEWSHPFQTGLDDHPLFSNWHPWSQGRDITTVESPDLCAFLFNECNTLHSMARTLHRNAEIRYLKAVGRRLRALCDSTWDEESEIYRYRDRDAHNAAEFDHISTLNGSGVFLIDKTLAVPARLLLHIHPNEAATRRVAVFLHGVSPGGAHRVERITTEGFKWQPGKGIATSERLYTVLEQVEIQGLMEDDRCVIYVSGLKQRDISLLLPLWAKIPSQKIAQGLIDEYLVAPGDFRSPYGIRAYLPNAGEWLEKPPNVILTGWNHLIIEGLLSYQRRQEAAEIFTSFMNAMTQSLRSEGCFRQFYHAETGQGIGERNTLQGLPPVGLFMKILGIRFLSPHRIFLEGFNPFPFPVTVKYRGTSVLRQRDKTTVIFPGGQTITTDRSSPAILSLK